MHWIMSALLFITINAAVPNAELFSAKSSNSINTVSHTLQHSTVDNFISHLNSKLGSKLKLCLKPYLYAKVPLVLWYCWLISRKSIRPIKELSDEVLAWLWCCLERNANDLHMVQLMLLAANPTSLLQYNAEWFILLVQLTGSSQTKGHRTAVVVVTCKSSDNAERTSV